MTKRFAVLIALALLLATVFLLAHETARWLERRSYPDTALHDAVKRDDLQELPELLALGFDTESRNGTGDTVLLTLLKRGPKGKPGAYLAALETLLDARADANATDKVGRSPILLVLPPGQRNRQGGGPLIEALVLLLDHGADPNTPDPNGWTPLAIAGRRDLTDAQALLIEAGAEIGPEESVAIGEFNTFRRFLERDSNLAHWRFTDLDLTLLLLAAIVDEPEMVSLLIEAEADPNYQDLEANGPLHHAIRAGASDTIVRMLVDAGADPNLPAGQGESALHLAAAAANPAVVRTLLEADADVGQIDRYGRTALHLVGTSMQTKHWNSAGEVVRILLDNGADVNAVDQRGLPLIISLVSRNLGLTPMLLEAGADPNTRDDEGRTPLFYVRDVEPAKILIDYGADVSLQDDAGNTLLHAAMRDYGWNEESFALAEIYLEHGLDISLRNGDGYTALDNILLYYSAIPPKWLTLFERYGAPHSLVSALQSGRMEDASNILQLEPKQAGVGTLAMAIRAGEPEIARQILEQGVDPNTHRLLNFGEGPVHVSPLLDIAMRLAKDDPQMAIQLVGLLLEYGLDADSYVSSGNRALFDAARNRQGGIVNLLLVNGADPDARDRQGRTALDFSMRRGLDDITELLIAHGARRGKAKASTN